MHFRARLAVSPICEASSKRQGDGQRFQKKAMKTTNSRIEASAPANVRPSSVSKHQMNRGLSTEAVLNCLADKVAAAIRAWPRLSASGFGWTFHQLGSRCWQRCFGLWAFIGTSGAASGSIRAGSLTPSEVIPPTPAPSIARTIPPMFCPLEHQRSKWLTKWLINQVETGHFNSDTIRLNHL